jgi:hypothetical protein
MRNKNNVKLLPDDVQKEIKGIIDGLKCSKDFACFRSGFETVCKAKDIGLETFLACMTKDPMECKFSLLFGGISFCECPLRIYICRKLKI